VPVEPDAPEIKTDETSDFDGGARDTAPPSTSVVMDQAIRRGC
jgi:hypothetical protein